MLHTVKAAGKTQLTRVVYQDGEVLVSSLRCTQSLTKLPGISNYIYVFSRGVLDHFDTKY